MHLLRAALLTFFALALALPAQAKPRVDVDPPRSGQLLTTGLHANQVEPLVRGIVAQGAQVAAFATCFLALDDNDTCIALSGKVRAAIE